MLPKWTTRDCEIYPIREGKSFSGYSFLIQQNSNYMLIDTGRKKSREMLLHKIEKILGPNNLAGIILTHSHIDHAENTAWFKKKFRCPVIIHQSEAEYLKKGLNPLKGGTNPMVRFLIKTLGKTIQAKYEFDGVTPDLLVDQRLDLKTMGINGYIIHTPGHTPGSMSVIIEDEVAIIGDALIKLLKWPIFPPFSENKKTMTESLAKLIDTGAEIFLPSHGREIKRKMMVKYYHKQKQDH